MSATNHATEPRELLLIAFGDLTTGEALPPDMQDAIANTVADAIGGIDNLTAQRDALLAALESTLPYLPTGDPMGIAVCLNARAAIAKARGDA